MPGKVTTEMSHPCGSSRGIREGMKQSVYLFLLDIESDHTCKEVHDGDLPPVHRPLGIPGSDSDHLILAATA